MSYKFVIDSSVWIEYFGGTLKNREIKAAIEQEDIATSIIAIVEIADKFEREKRKLDLFLDYVTRRSEIIPIAMSIARKAAMIKQEIRVTSKKFGIADAIHLATAAYLNTTLVTADSDFRGIKSVKVV